MLSSLQWMGCRSLDLKGLSDAQIRLLHCYFQGVDLTPKKGVKKKRYKATPFLE